MSSSNKGILQIYKQRLPSSIHLTKQRLPKQVLLENISGHTTVSKQIPFRVRRNWTNFSRVGSKEPKVHY